MISRGVHSQCFLPQKEAPERVITLLKLEDSENNQKGIIYHSFHHYRSSSFLVCVTFTSEDNYVDVFLERYLSVLSVLFVYGFFFRNMIDGVYGRLFGPTATTLTKADQPSALVWCSRLDRVHQAGTPGCRIRITYAETQKIFFTWLCSLLSILLRNFFEFLPDLKP